MKSLAKIGVTLDFYGTLVEVDRDVPTIGQELTARGYPCSPAVEAIWNSEGFDGRRTHDPVTERYEDWRRACIGELARLCGVPEAEAATLAGELIECDRRWTVRPCEGAARLIVAATSPAVECGLLTNWDYSLAPYLEMARLPANLTAIVSAEIGYRKPHPAAFTRARTLLGVTASRHIHVGDSWSTDVVGAVQSGAWALWVTDQQLQQLPPRIVQTSRAAAGEVLVAVIEKIRETE